MRVGAMSRGAYVLAGALAGGLAGAVGGGLAGALGGALVTSGAWGGWHSTQVEVTLTALWAASRPTPTG